jgi:hypothetical protein
LNGTMANNRVYNPNPNFNPKNVRPVVQYQYPYQQKR